MNNWLYVARWSIVLALVIGAIDDTARPEWLKAVAYGVAFLAIVAPLYARRNS